MYCQKCGSEMADDAVFCSKCGASLVQDAPKVQNIYHTGYEISEMNLPAKYQPLGAWAYFGYALLFSIPLIGLICLIVFSFSDSNINRRNYARSYWCILVVVIIVLLVMGVSLSAIVSYGSRR